MLRSVLCGMVLIWNSAGWANASTVVTICDSSNLDTCYTGNIVPESDSRMPETFYRFGHWIDQAGIMRQLAIGVTPNAGGGVPAHLVNLGTNSNPGRLAVNENPSNLGLARNPLLQTVLFEPTAVFEYPKAALLYVSDPRGTGEGANSSGAGGSAAATHAPEPGAFLLFASALAAIAIVRRTRASG